MAAFTGGIIGPHYATSKAALIGLAPYGVAVSTIAPALIGTDMMPGDPEQQQRLAQGIPVGRLGQPEEVAEAVLSLIANPYITNQTILVDGGIYPH